MHSNNSLQRALAVAIAFAISGAAVAQPGDESVARTYARECPNDEESQLCNTLRKVMVRRGDTAAPRPGAARSPARRALPARGRTAARTRMAVPASPPPPVAPVVPPWIGIGVSPYTSKELGRLPDPARPPVRVRFTTPGGPAREAGVLAGDIVTMVAGVPVSTVDFVEVVGRLPVGKPAEFTVMRRAAATALTITPVARPSEDEQRERLRTDKTIPREAAARLLRPGTPIPSVTSDQDAGDSHLWRVACFQISVEPGHGVRIDLNPFGQRSVLMITPNCTPRAGAFEAVDNGGPRNDLSLVTETDATPRYVQAWFRGSDRRYVVAATILDARQLATWREQKRQAALAKSQRGDSGLLGGLMMAAGAAMAGGNAQQVMGFGMKGAEMTTDNAYTRRALSGVGDQFVSDGMQTMAMQNAARNPPATRGRPGAAPARATSSGPAGALAGVPGGDRGITAYVACYLYGQYDDGTNRKWHFYISQIGQMQAGTGEAWPDSPSDAISQTWGAYLRQRGADVDGHAGGANPRYPTCHGSRTMAEVQGQRAQWLRDARSGGNYTIHEENWAPR